MRMTERQQLYEEQNISLLTIDSVTAQQSPEKREYYHALFRKLYDGLYKEKFGSSEYSADYDLLFNKLTDDPQALPRSVSILGKNLDNPESAEIYGFAIGQLFPESGVGYSWYVAKDEKIKLTAQDGQEFKIDTKELRRVREESLRKMAEHYGTELYGSVWESVSPDHDHHDGMDPWDRLAVLTKIHSGTVVPICYQLPFPNKAGNGIEYVEDYLLCQHGSENGLPPEKIKQFLNELYRTYYDIAEPEKDPGYQYMAKQLDALAAGQMLDEKQEHIREIAKKANEMKHQPPRQINPAALTIEIVGDSKDRPIAL